jgi:hypothetical protein
MALHRGAWYRRTEDVISVCDSKVAIRTAVLRESRLWLRELAEERFPSSRACHIILRLETLVPEERGRIARLLDLEQDIPDEQRTDELVSLLNDRILPAINRGSSVQGLREMVEDGTLASAGIRGPALRTLGVRT